MSGAFKGKGGGVSRRNNALCTVRGSHAAPRRSKVATGLRHVTKKFSRARSERHTADEAVR